MRLVSAITEPMVSATCITSDMSAFNSKSFSANQHLTSRVSLYTSVRNFGMGSGRPLVKVCACVAGGSGRDTKVTEKETPQASSGVGNAWEGKDVFILLL